MVIFEATKCSKTNFFRGSAPDAAGEFTALSQTSGVAVGWAGGQNPGPPSAGAPEFKINF